jgi:hypothetical protein
MQLKIKSIILEQLNIDNIINKINNAPDHPGMGKQFITPAGLGYSVVSGNVKAPFTQKQHKITPVTELNLDSIENGQNTLGRVKLINQVQNYDLHNTVLTVAHKDGKYHLLDGNHRFHAKKLLGHTSAKVKIIPAEYIKTY